MDTEATPGVTAPIEEEVGATEEATEEATEAVEEETEE